MGNSTDVTARFAEKVDVSPASGCWAWRGELTRGGYPRFWDGHRKVQAHRFSYELHVGEIPDGLTIDHLCRNRGCVNPAHLEPVTMGVNSLRAPGSVNAIHARVTRCPQGHPYNVENTLTSGGKRYCRTCRRHRAAEARRRARVS